MKNLYLTTIAAGVMLSTSAMAAEVVVAEPVAVTTQPVVVNAQPAYQYDANAGVVANTTGAVVGTTRTLFDTVTNPAAVSAEVGTLGYGANVAWGVNDTTELVAGWAGGDVADLVGDDVDVNDVDYDVEMDMSNPYLGVNLRPAANWFTVGAGVIVPDVDIEVKSNPDGDGVYKINGNEYQAEEVGSLEGEMEYRNKLAPYGTIGFRPNINDNWGVYGEIGAAYMGEVDATVRSTAGNDDIARDAEQDLEEEDYLEWYPIAKLGLTYRF